MYISAANLVTMGNSVRCQCVMPIVTAGVFAVLVVMAILHASKFSGTCQGLKFFQKTSTHTFLTQNVCGDFLRRIYISLYKNDKKSMPDTPEMVTGLIRFV